MSPTIALVQDLVRNGQVRLSAHGYAAQDEDDILYEEVLTGLSTGIVVEDYPDAGRGPCALVLQRDTAGRPVHVLWGLHKTDLTRAVLITAYRPDPDRWTADFVKRK
jgi:hypothetical protein